MYQFKLERSIFRTKMKLFQKVRHKYSSLHPLGECRFYTHTLTLVGHSQASCCIPRATRENSFSSVKLAGSIRLVCGCTEESCFFIRDKGRQASINNNSNWIFIRRPIGIVLVNQLNLGV